MLINLPEFAVNKPSILWSMVLSLCFPGCRLCLLFRNPEACVCDVEHVFDLFFYLPDRVCHQQGLSPWVPFQNAATAVTNLYKGTAKDSPFLTRHTRVSTTACFYIIRKPPNSGHGYFSIRLKAPINNTDIYCGSDPFPRPSLDLLECLQKA